MKYLCLIYFDETYRQSRSKDEMDQIFGEYRAFADSITQSGHYLGANRLQPTNTAKTVRVRNGRASMTDGPFAETKEQLGGYFLVEASDLEEATQLAVRIPGARFGSVEVRPVMELPVRADVQPSALAAQ